MENHLIDEKMLKPLEDVLRCRICSEFYNNCVMTICFHNFCSVCIKKRLANDDDCPNCFEIIKEHDLRSNKLLDKIVRLYKKLQQRDNNKSHLTTQHLHSKKQVQSDSDIQMISHKQLNPASLQCSSQQVDSDSHKIQKNSHYSNPLFVQSSPQRTVTSTSKASSQNSSLIQAFSSGLTDLALTHPIKLEIIECNDIDDVEMSTDSNEKSHTQKKFAVVEFIKSSSVEVIPSIWLINESQGRWPQKKSSTHTSKCIRECMIPEVDWDTLDLKVIAYSKTFKGADKKADKAQFTSHIESDSSSEEDISIRKKKKPYRYSEFSGDDTTVKKAKKQCIRSTKDLAVEKNKSLPYGGTSSDEEYVLPSKTKTKRFHPPQIPISRVIASPSQDRLNLSPSSLSDSSVLRQNKGEEANSIRVYTMMTKVFEKLEEICNVQTQMRKDVARLLSKQDEENFSSNLASEGVLLQLPEGIELPITDDAELVMLEEQLKQNRNLQSLIIHYLENICSGKSMSAFLLSICRRLMTKEVAIQYSRLGRKGKKCFESLSAVTNVILATASRRYPTSKRQEVSEKFGKILATATDWDGRKPKLTADDTVDWLNTEAITDTDTNSFK